jgi:ATP-binding protein involved in chromosome partitioning
MQRQHVTQHIEGVSRLIAVASGKGGVGKTTVAVNLALALALSGAKVGLFDADLYGPNVPLMLGVHQTKSERATFPVARTGRESYIKPLERYGLKVMSVGLLVAETEVVQPDPRLVGMFVKQTLLDVQWGELDYLLIDLPPGTGEPQQTLVQGVHLDGVVVVTTPQDLSLLDAGRSLRLFRQMGVPILGVIENMSYLACPHCGEPIEVFERSDRDWALKESGLEVLGNIPLELKISQAINAGHPLMQSESSSEATAAFRDIAARLAARFAKES